jgi:amidase
VIVLEDAFAESDDPVADLLRSALEMMAEDLPLIEHARIAPEGFDPWREAFRIVQAYETWQSFGTFVARYRPNIGPGIRERVEFASTVTAAQADAARAPSAQEPDAPVSSPPADAAAAPSPAPPPSKPPPRYDFIRHGGRS